MRRVAPAAVLAVVLLGTAAAGGASAPPSPWDGAVPFACELQKAGEGTTVKHPDADPFCIDFDKTHQNVSELGVVAFVSKEPARVALASDKCFYFQSDHWRGSIVQSDGSTKTYEWDGHYFFDKATGDGGAWVTNFNVNGHTGDPSTIPGMPADYAEHFGPGTGGAITHDEIPADPSCVAKAAAHPPYATPPADRRPATCREPTGGVGARHLGPVTLGMPESKVWAELGTPARVQRGFLRFCLPGGGKLMVGLRGDRSGVAGGPGHDPAVFLLTTHRTLKLHGGIGRGTRAAAVRAAFPRAREWFVAGRTHIVRLGSGLLAGIRHGHVRMLVVYDPVLVHGAGAVLGWLRRSA
ncbi:MAG: hypothetical protein QOG68_2344 [Solirubrobacteraceae bacterium]|nr:hypothetical protein [Solirubrobacteraceae bacterium]